MTLGQAGAAEFTKFDASLTNTDYYVGKDRAMTSGQNVTVSANVAIDPDAGLINRGSRANHDNAHNNPYAPRNKAEEWAALPEYPQGFPQGYSQALSDKQARKKTAPIPTDKARTNFVNTLGGLASNSPPQENAFSSRLFRSGVAGRPGSPQRFYSDGDSFYASRP